MNYAQSFILSGSILFLALTQLPAARYYLNQQACIDENALGTLPGVPARRTLARGVERCAGQP